MRLLMGVIYTLAAGMHPCEFVALPLYKWGASHLRESSAKVHDIPREIGCLSVAGDTVMGLKATLASCLVIALGLILAIHFTLFWMYGGVFIYESNKVLLSIETAMSFTIVGFGMERLINSTIRRQE